MEGFLSTNPQITPMPRMAAISRSSQFRFASIKSFLSRRSRGGYPGIANSEKTTRSHWCSTARSAACLILSKLCLKSPIMGLICAMAIFIIVHDPFCRNFFIKVSISCNASGVFHKTSGSALNHVIWRFAYLLVSRFNVLTVSSQARSPFIKSTIWR